MEIVRCKSCNRETYGGMAKCPHCASEDYELDLDDGKISMETQEVRNNNSSNRVAGTGESFPSLSILFFVMAGLSLLGGFILCAEFWPGDPGYGKEWKTIAYLPSITWFTAGVIEFALFTAMGQGLAYLHRIVINTSNSE